ncbi:DUF5916 domain-containing protein [Longimicrobium sp.]|uniref:DUF5916 domain-containing protein n=1 Tax=Longimicrobium sp. TaxID=2029185 RepID=UPI003B3B3255
MRYAALGLLLAALPATVLAQGTPAPAGGDPHAGAPSISAVRATGAVRVDGRLDDAAWGATTPATQLTQLEPAEGRPVSERTEVRVLYDDEALYVGVRLHDSAPVTTRLGRRDMSMEASDWLTVILDSYHDHRTAFGFELNPSGVRRDQTRSEETGEDDSWDPVWVGETSVDSGGWTAEMRIPFSQLRFNTAASQTWGIQVERQIARKGEFAVLAFTPATQPGGIPRFGHLEGLANVRTGKRLEVLPYTVVKAEHVERGDNPFREDREYSPSVGADLKYRLTSDLTLDATINPDFGQVEVDPAEVNLSAIETRFQERRPFFVEGADIFNFGAGGGNTAFYSRRIGRTPQVPVGYTLADVPIETRILGAAKISGRTRDGWSVGLLNAVTGREEARFIDIGAEGDSLRGRQAVEPLSNYFVGRLRRELRGGQTVVGGMFTALNRDLDEDALRNRLHGAAYNGGVDFRHQWKNREWQLRGFVSGSHIRGDRRAIARTQLVQSFHYFQRPDQDEVRFDSLRTSLSGVSTEFQLSYRPGRHWRPALLVGTTTPGYDVNDMGFQYRANRADLQGTLSYVENRPGKTFRNYQFNGYARGEWNYDGDHIYNNFSLTSFGQFLNFWFAEVTVGTTLPGSVDDKLTWGGPLARRPGVFRMDATVGSDDRKAVMGLLQGLVTRDDEGGSTMLMGAQLQLKPSPRWNLSITPLYERSRVGAQYIMSTADAAAVNTFGRRYVLSELEQTTLSLETRLNVTFTTDLSLQVYAQPFLSSADYGTPAELARPRTYDFDVYGEDVGDLETVEGGYYVYPQGVGEGQPRFFVANRDFNLRSLRGNAVLRWEWRPGSTLYLAWQQDRSDYAPYVGDFSMSRDRRALFDAQPDNVLVLKVSYWLNP